MDLEKTKIQEIVRLHSEVVGHLKQSLEKAIKIGQLLSEQKQALNHGEFTPWLEANIPFTDRTARNYMKVYRERDRIKTETVSGLKGAYALLSPRSEEPPDCFNADAWAEIIDLVNNEFFSNLKEYRIDTTPGKIFELMNEKDDGSMTEREKKGFFLWVNFHKHLCFWVNYAKAKGKDKLHPQVRRYLDRVNEDNPIWKNDYKVCGKSCGQKF